MRDQRLRVHVIDGTYELFRHFYAVPSARDEDGREVGAVRAVVASVLGMVNRGATHVGVATDHVIESFRNRLWPGYKTGAGIDPDLLSQFGLLEDALAALGVMVWPIVELNRRTNVVRDEAGVVAKFGVRPGSIPDYLALVGDAADGYPGLAGWGAKSSAAVLARYEHFEAIPDDSRTWGVNAANAATLAATFARERDRAFLFRDLATLRTDIPVFGDVDELRWTGPTAAFAPLAAKMDRARPSDARAPGGDDR